MMKIENAMKLDKKVITRSQYLQLANSKIVDQETRRPTNYDNGTQLVIFYLANMRTIRVYVEGGAR